MLRKMPRAAWIALPLAYLLYFFHLGAVGLLGPDEPRYASIAREMARSGDWITPRLWGLPWFEKPALMYWLEGAAFRVGLDTELAPRLPMALLSVAFLVFYWWILRREFGQRVAGFAVLILGTCGAWIGFSQIGTSDMPLTATFSAAMLLVLPWISRRDARYLPVAGALLGLAVLAKGLVPLVLVLPAVWWGRSLVWPAPGARKTVALSALTFVAVAVPWYVLCYLQNGLPFLMEFFWKHHIERFASTGLKHTQPWWFYLPVLAATFIPWTALFPLLFRRTLYREPRRVFLLAWLLFGLVFFSASANKLPGYLLPLLPAVAALLALALDEIRNAAPYLAGCAVLLVAFPMAGPMLPVALEAGLSRAPRPEFHWTWVLPVVAILLVWMFEGRGRRLAALLTVAVTATAGTVWLKVTALPVLDSSVSARPLWREIAPRAAGICTDGLQRDWRYGLNYYSEIPLPECAAQFKPLQLRQTGGLRPYLQESAPRH